jgi:hypothetical protein
MSRLSVAFHIDHSNFGRNILESQNNLKLTAFVI